MAQSTIKDTGKSPLWIQPFWEKATLEPPLRWEYWRTQLKFAILAREGNVVDFLLADPPKHVVLTPEPTYEDSAENPTAQPERTRSTYPKWTSKDDMEKPLLTHWSYRRTMRRQTLENLRSESIPIDVLESWNRRTTSFQFKKYDC